MPCCLTFSTIDYIIYLFITHHRSARDHVYDENSLLFQFGSSRSITVAGRQPAFVSRQINRTFSCVGGGEEAATASDNERQFIHFIVYSSLFAALPAADKLSAFDRTVLQPNVPAIVDVFVSASREKRAWYAHVQYVVLQRVSRGGTGIR